MLLAAPFDRLAADYDRSFSASVIGQRMRAAVWRRLDAAFRPGERVLELNCGTGEDAVHMGGRGVRVLATDSSPAMLAVTRAKVARSGLTGLVEVAPLAIEQLARDRPAGPFDGVLSNFGGLNCVEDLPAVSRQLATLTATRAQVCCCAMMGPAVPWEWVWYLARGEPAQGDAAAEARWRTVGRTDDPLSVDRRGAARFRPAFRQRGALRRSARWSRPPSPSRGPRAIRERWPRSTLSSGAPRPRGRCPGSPIIS
jgi:ubiquinone/menaquinone biosynthesis C-methylase UbiE